jgi:hypothetical protein
MAKPNYIFLFVFIIQFFPITFSFAQGCCTAGSSTFGGLERGASGYGNLNLSFSYILNSLNSTYNGSDEITDPLNRTASVSSFNFESEYGLVEKVSLLISGTYIVKNRETTVRSNETNETEVIEYNGKGFGDVIILGKYEVISPDIVSPVSLAFGGGVKLPVGSYTQEVDGSRLAIDLQPGTGSLDALLWGNFYKGFLPAPFSLSANALYKYSGSNLDGYRFGDEFIFSLNSEYSFTDYLTISLSLRGRYANEDFWGGRFLPSTGGSYYDLIPSLIYTESSFNLKLFYVSPLHRTVEGIQLTSSGSIGVEFLYAINVLNITD